MRLKILLVGCASILVSAVVVPAAQAADYAAIAAGPGGSAWVEGGFRSLEGARGAAIARCRNAGFGSCSVSTAERSDWYFGAGFCNDVPYTAATPQGSDRLLQIIRMKGAADGNFDCYLGNWF